MQNRYNPLDGSIALWGQGSCRNVERYQPCEEWGSSIYSNLPTIKTQSFHLT